MTVKELIEALSKLDQSKTVFIWDADSAGWDSVNEAKVDHHGDIIIV